MLKSKNNTLNVKDRAYHYIPYKSDSDFEKDVYYDILKLETFNNKKLEVYYNGDDNLTEFKIMCYEVSNNIKKYIGKYVPDILLLSRKNNEINKILILETKGKIYATDPTFLKKRKWMSDFLLNNNQNYKKYDYLYIEDTMDKNEILNNINDKILEFFGEK